MMGPSRFFVLPASLMLWLMAGCADMISPSASGTEVGNPEIHACVSALMKLAEDDSSWRLQHHLHESLLDPADITPPHVRAKRSAQLQDSCLVYIIDTAVYTDTAYIPDTVYIRDTLVQQRIRPDTAVNIVDGDTLVKVDSAVVLDSIIIDDTVYAQRKQITIDTVYASRQVIDCDLVGVGVDFHPVLQNTQTVILEPPLEYDEMVYFPENDSVTYNVRIHEGNVFSIMDPNSPNINKQTSRNVYSVSKDVYASDGARGSMRYTDGDGDGFIYSAAAGEFPSVLLTGVITKPGKRTVLNSEFNTGADRSFGGTGDNRMLALVRRDISGLDTVKTVLLETSPGPQVLAVSEQRSNDSLTGRTSRYTLPGGEGLLSLALSHVEQDLVYSDIGFTRIAITAVPDVVAATSVSDRTFEYTAQVFNAAGSVLLLSGEVSATAGLTGEYEYKGKVYTVTAVHSDTIVIKEKL